MRSLLLFFRFCFGSCRHVRLPSLFRKTTTIPLKVVRVARVLLLILQLFSNLKHLSNGKCF
nr:MAG TPA: hypothetical protein [Microviridae sp.]